jgi:hypothetical protein
MPRDFVGSHRHPAAIIDHEVQCQRFRLLFSHLVGGDLQPECSKCAAHWEMSDQKSHHIFMPVDPKDGAHLELPEYVIIIFLKIELQPGMQIYSPARAARGKL